MATVDLTEYKENSYQNGSCAISTTLDYTDRGDSETVVSGDVHQTIVIPANCLVTGVWVNVKTAFDSATSAVLDVGDGGAGARYADDVDLKTAGITAVTDTPYFYATSDTIDLTPVIVGATTEGVVQVVVTYVDLEERKNYNK